MTKLLNPYIAGAPILESSMFFGREDVFGWIERSLAGKYVDNILVIHGQRRVGKTSVLKQIPNYLDEKYIQVFFDLQGRLNTTLDRFLYWIARETYRTLQNEIDLDIPKPNQQKISDNPEYLIAEYFPAIQKKLSDRVLLLTFDEFDTLTRDDIQESLAGPLIAYLRRLMALDGLNFIFSIGSSGNQLENMQASYTDFFKAALYRKISFLDQESCHRLITKPVEEEINYKKAAVDKIYQITAGHPYFTQLMCHELFSLCQKTGAREIRIEDVESVVEDVIERGTVNLKFVWDEASDLEKWTLASLAQLSNGASKQQVTLLLNEQRVRFVDSDLNSAILHLREKDVITKENRFIIRLMQLWLKQNRPLDRVREELVEVNPIANRLIEIGDEYKDRGDIDSAIDSYQQAVEADPGGVRAHLKLAQAFMDAASFQQAIQSFEKVLTLDIDDVAAQTGMSDACLALGDQSQTRGEEEEAEGYYQQVLTFNESHEDALNKLSEIYSSRAELLLAKGKDDQALNTFNQAMEYTPDNEELSNRYQDVLTKKKAEVIEGWLQKADRALDRQQWETATEALENALKISPGDEALITRLATIEEGYRQDQLENYQQNMDQALAAEDWERALHAGQQVAELASEDPGWEEKIQQVKVQQHNAQLKKLRSQAEAAAAAEQWKLAIQSWEEYLALDPDDTELSQERLQYAHKYNSISQDYQRAQELIRKRDYNRALQLLQGIITQDPKYKATSRLLVEAVEAKEQRTGWKSGWIYGGIGMIVIIVVGIIFRTELLSSFTGLFAGDPTNTPVKITQTLFFTSTPQPSSTPTPHPAEVFASPYLAYISETAPDFEDDFSTVKEEWQLNVKGVPQENSSEFVSQGSFVANVTSTAGEHTCVSLGSVWGKTPLSANQFVLAFDFKFMEGTANGNLTIQFRVSGMDSGYNFLLNADTGSGDEAHFGVLVEGTSEIPVSGEAGEYLPDDDNRIQLIVGPSEAAVYLNQQPLTYLPEIEESGSLTQIEICTFDKVSAKIDNVQFWNLDEVEISPQETASTTIEPGITKISSRDGMTQIYLPAGKFLMGLTDEQYQLLIDSCGEWEPSRERCMNALLDEIPQHEVLLDAYWIDTEPITKKQYANFLTSNGNVDSEGNSFQADPSIVYEGGGWRSLSGSEDQPAEEISWYGAQAYCEWVGRTLPTEAEWENAILERETSSIFNLISFQEDTSEWVSDWYLADYYLNSSYRNPQGPVSGIDRVQRSGIWFGIDQMEIGVSKRQGWAPFEAARFRCAQSAE